jgi:hypothetical protein
MHILKPLSEDYSRLSEIYQKIFEKNAIAFLGGGASVTNNKFLSKDLIEYYEAKISKHFGTIDIIKFVDILQVTPNQRRIDFDRFVVEHLSKLKPNEGHNIFVTIPWKQVITTNFDTLIEEASSNAIRDKRTHFELKTIKCGDQFDYQSNNNEIVYIKLNGCKSDLSLYPLVFSTEDFSRQMPYYRKVLSPFKQVSNEVIFIAFGYSFTDIFSEKLLDRMFSTDFRQKKIIYSVDPFANDDSLAYLESKGIEIIKISFEDFFKNYKIWFEANHKNYLKGLQKFTNPDNSIIKIETASRLYLDRSIIQLKDDYRVGEKLKKIDFYFGAEPNYQIVVDDYDVVKKLELNKLIKSIEESFNENSKTIIPKLILVDGDFGSGKTTFTLRAIKEYLKQNNNTLAFEIIQSVGVKKGYLAHLIKESSATQFIFYCDNIETDSVFKSFNELRVDLASEQYSNINIIFISSIRENILEKYKNSNKMLIKNNIEFEYNASYSELELIELVENLKEVGLVHYRDTVEKRAIVSTLKKEYKGDSFISLYKLIEKGSHYKLLQKAYEELTPDIKTAFKITALVHRFNMECPVSVIKNSIMSLDWNDFTEKIVRGDGKKILFQERKRSMTSDPDLFFRTKHPVIADALIKLIMKNTEKNSLYKSIFSSLTFSEFNARFIVDLIKNIRANDTDITDGQIQNYYEICKKEFEISPHFMISYITNIEKRTNSVNLLEQCIEDIEILEGSLQYRNHRLIHRKGALNFKIAKILHSEKYSTDEVMKYLHMAEDWFKIKKQIDPSSHYSYVDYFNLLIWKLNYLRLDDEEKLHLNLTINNLFDEAFRVLYENTGIVMDLFEEYKSSISIGESDTEYLDFLLNKYQDVKHRSLACILLYYYYYDTEDYEKCEDFIDEMKNYTDEKDVVYFLFKYYGRNLHSPANRISYSELIRNNDFLEKLTPMRYNYFTSICDAYDYRWYDAKEYLNEIRFVKQSNINPDFFLYWRKEDGSDQIFEGEIILDKKIKKVQISRPFFKQILLVKGKYDKYKEGRLVSVKLRFFIEGIRAEIIEHNS